MFKKKDEKNKRINADDFMSAIVQMAINEVEYMESLLRMNNLSCEFERLIASTFAYYFSVWLAYIEKNEQLTYNIIKEKMEYVAKGLITDNCNENNKNKDAYIEVFNNNFSSGIIEAKSSINGDTFYDKGFTDKYLISVIGMQNASNVKAQVQIRILQYWVKPASEGMKKTNII